MCPKSKSYTNRRNYIVGKPEMRIVKALQFVPFPSLAHLMPWYTARSILVLAIRLLVEW